jgi:hypothetical protein
MCNMGDCSGMVALSIEGSGLDEVRQVFFLDLIQAGAFNSREPPCLKQSPMLCMSLSDIAF